MSYIRTETGWEFIGLIHKFCFGDLKDAYNGVNFWIRYKKHNWGCSGGEHNYGYSLDNIKMRLQGISKLEMAKMMG